MKAHASALLQIADHAEQVVSLRVAARAEHADQALGRRAGRRAELLEADRGLDVIAQDGLAVSTSPPSIASMPSRRRASANFDFPLTSCCTRPLKAPAPCHRYLRSAPSALALHVVPPVGVNRIDIAPLALLRAAGPQGHQPSLNPRLWVELDHISGAPTK